MPKTDKLGIGNSYISRAQIIADFLATKDDPKRRREFLRLVSDGWFFRSFIKLALRPEYDFYVSEDALRNPDKRRLRQLYYDNHWNWGTYTIPSSILQCPIFLNTTERITTDGRIITRTQEKIDKVMYFLYFERDDTELEIYIQLLSNTLDLGITAEEIEDIIPDFFTRK
ncbi:MAG: hypothetical protein LUG57_04175 [Oscillospiraceae bacterium]|nr:hypothetical protein [Oscillospiraceae bacterium]